MFVALYGLGMGIVAIQYELYVITGDSTIGNLIFIGLLIINLLLYKRLTGRGIRQFEML